MGATVIATGLADSMLGQVPSPVYAQAHTGDPGSAGTANVAPGTQVRGAVTLAAASGGQRVWDAAVEVSGITAGTEVTHVSFWDAASAGNFRFSVALDSPVTAPGMVRVTLSPLSLAGATTSGTPTGVTLVVGAGEVVSVGLRVTLGLAVTAGAGGVVAGGVMVAEGAAVVEGAGDVVVVGELPGETPTGDALVAGAGAVLAAGVRASLGAAIVDGAGAVVADGMKPSAAGPVLDSGFPVNASKLNVNGATIPTSPPLTFSTPAADRLIVVAAAFYTPSDDPYPMTVAWNGGTPAGCTPFERQTWPAQNTGNPTYSFLGDSTSGADAHDGTIHWTTQIWTAWASVQLTNAGVVATRNYPGTEQSTGILSILSYSAAYGIGAKGQHHTPMSEVGGSNRVIELALTAAQANSRIAGILQWGNLPDGGSFTANGVTTIDYQAQDGGADGGAALFHLTSLTAAGTQYTVGVTQSQYAWSMSALEILAAPETGTYTLYDPFTGSNGSAPDGTRWPSTRNLAGGTLDIQSNALRIVSNGTVDGEENTIYDDVGVLSLVLTGVSKTAAVKATPAANGFIQDVRIYAGVGGGDLSDTQNAIVLRITRTGTNTATADLFRYSGGVYTPLASNVSVSGAAGTYEMVLMFTGTTVTARVGSTAVGSASATHGVSLGSSVRVALVGIAGGSPLSGTFDEFVVA